MIQSLKGFTPQIGENTFVAPSADIIGEVTIGRESSIWYQCVLRGDVGPIVVGDYTNIQDGTVVHCTYNKHFTTIGSRVTIGHKVMLHGCTVGDEAFVGMGAILLDGSVMAPRSFLAAGALLPQGAQTESGWLYMGSPAKKVRPLKDSELEFLGQSAQNYYQYKSWYLGTQKEEA
jgi:carbonic anhydrase/acetyltransferase-like protein (isoleucine patch superfamily)